MNITVSTKYHSVEATWSSSRSISSVLLALKECGASRNLELGRFFHSQASDTGLICNLYVANTLINMYGKCGSMLDAQRVFNEMPRHTIVSWNCLIQGLVENGLSESALENFHLLEEDCCGCSPDSVTYVHALSACVSLAEKITGDSEKWFEKGLKIYSESIRNRCCNVFVENMVMKLCLKVGSVVQARDVFDKMPRRDIVSWNILMQGYVESGEFELALETFDRIEDVSPNSRSFLAAIGACTRLAAGENSQHWFETGKKLHSRAETCGCFDVYVGSSLVDLYGKCGEMLRARALFDEMSSRNVVTWNCLLQGYVDNDAPDSALELFERMRDDCHPDLRTYVIALTAAGSGDDRVDQVKFVHSRALMSDQCCRMIFYNTLINVYSRCGRSDEARRVFDCMVERDIISWNSMLQGYVDNKEYNSALELYEDMVEEAGNSPDDVSFLGVLTACCSLAEKQSSKSEKLCRKWLKKSQALHSQILRSSMKNNLMKTLETKLMSLYFECLSPVNACFIFNNMVKQDIQAWNTLIQGYSDNGEDERALKLFVDSISEIEPNSGSFEAALQACGNLMGLEPGRKIDAEVKKLGLEDTLGASLVEFYGKCGSMHEVEQVFNSISERDVGVWNSLLLGFSRKGDTGGLFRVVKRMEDERIRLNEISFTHILSACSHAGLSEEAGKYFEEMQVKYGIKPDEIHRACMVDLFVRAGASDEALRVIKPGCELDDVIRTTVLSDLRNNL